MNPLLDSENLLRINFFRNASQAIGKKMTAIPAPCTTEETNKSSITSLFKSFTVNIVQDSVTHLSPETAVLIAVNSIQELFQRIHLGFGLIGLPALVLPHPEDPPSAFGSNEGCLGNR